jgi:hypothetical protein
MRSLHQPVRAVTRWALPAVLVALLWALAAAGGADRRVEAQVPAGFEARPEHGAAIAAGLQGAEQFGGLPFAAGAEAYVDEAQGAALYLSWIVTSAKPDDDAAAVRAQLDRLRAAPREAAVGAGAVEIVSWDEEATDGLVDARLTWRHLRNETVTLSRSLLYLDAAGHPAQVTAECVVRAESVAVVGEACDQALASLSVGAAERTALGPLPPARADQPPARPAPPPPSGVASRQPPSLQPAAEAADGPGVIYMAPTKERSRDHRWLFLAGGVLLVIAFLYTGRGRRDERDSDEGDESAVDADGDGDDGDGDGVPADARAEDRDGEEPGDHSDDRDEDDRDEPGR